MINICVSALVSFSCVVMDADLAAAAVVSALFVKRTNWALLFGGLEGSLLLRLLFLERGGVGGRWMRRATYMSKQRFML